MNRAALILSALVLALPLSLLARRALHLEEVPGARQRRARLEATRDSLRAELLAARMRWAAELETTWRPRLQVGGVPDSVSPSFVLVAIGGGAPRPAGLPEELGRLTNLSEVAPPEHAGNWLATRVKDSRARFWLVARPLRPHLGDDLTRVSGELGDLADARLSRGARYFSFAGPYALTALLCVGAALAIPGARARPRRRNP